MKWLLEDKIFRKSRKDSRVGELGAFFTSLSRPTRRTDSTGVANYADNTIQPVPISYRRQRN